MLRFQGASPSCDRRLPVMTERAPTSAPSTRSSREIPVGRPRWAFSKGVLVGAAIEVPAITAAVWVVAQLGVGDPEVGFFRMMWLTAVFAGIAALFTAGGIGRLAASVVMERGRKRAVMQAARAHAVAGAGLVLIAVIPHGNVPSVPSDWVAVAACGLIPGALCGATIGWVCSGVTPVGFSDVWSLAKRPAGGLKQLLDPRDLVKLGTALRTRTTNLFEGIFDPAPPPPSGVGSADGAGPGSLAKAGEPAKEPAPAPAAKPTNPDGANGA
jgi:hypothetical protein